MEVVGKQKIDPLSRIPSRQRLVMAIRGAAGVGKSFFIRSMSEAGLGKLCIFDTERKARLLRGVGISFDALEIKKTDELPEFVEWAINGEGIEQNYGCFALDSWATYFSAKHSEMIQALRKKTKDPLAQPTSEDLVANQIISQNVLRKLCIESGKSVVIADQLLANTKYYEQGEVLPTTISGIEYFVDVMVEVSLQKRAREIVRVFRVVKSNFPIFEVGFELSGNVTFKDFLDKIRDENKNDLSFETPNVVGIKTKDLSIDELISKAESNGFTRGDLVTGARIYHKQPNIYHLTAQQIADLDVRISARIEKRKALLNNLPKADNKRAA